MTHAPIPAVAVADLPDDAKLLDVRELEEWDAGHAPGAQHVPLSELTERIDEIPEADRVFVICRSGVRSARVVAFLAGQGFRAINVAGGMESWAAEGRAVVADDLSEGKVI